MRRSSPSPFETIPAPQPPQQRPPDLRDRLHRCIYNPCVFCAALKVAAHLRTGAMCQVVEAERLQLQAGGYINMAITQDVFSPTTVRYIMRACIRIVAAHLTSGGIVGFLHVNIATQISQYFRGAGFPIDMPDTMPVPTVAMAGTDQVMDVSYAIQALAPLMHMHTLDFAGTGHDTYVHTGLQALAYLRNRSALIWPALWSLGLKAELLELVYRLHLSMAYQTRPEYHQAILLINTQRILDLAPNNVFNARAVCINPFIGLSTKYDVVLATTKAAKRNNDDVAMSVLLWELCQILLLGGGGPTFKKSIIDHIVHHGITYTTHSCRWGGHLIMGHRKEVMWRCVGAAEGLKAQSGGDVFSAFTSEEHLQAQVIHVTCDACMQLTRPSKISRCQACLQVKYCSTECQTFHWMRVHSTECPAGNSLPHIEDLQQN